MSTHFTDVAEKAVFQRKAVLNRINQIWGELENLRSEVSDSMPEAESINEALDYGCTHMMNCSIEVEAALHENLPEQNRIEEATLEQLLSVLTMIRSCSPRSLEETRSATSFASSLTAKACGIERNTIYDIWVRRLNLPGQTRGFNEMVFEWLSRKPDRLRQVIKAHVDGSLHFKIDEFFRS
jgi:hypothetical protein